MTKLKVTIDEQNKKFIVENNGKGIPVEIHGVHKIYVPEMIFGHLLTSSNYEDSDERTVGGLNGLGAKLTNIFSSKFIVECGDKERHKQFTGEWS